MNYFAHGYRWIDDPYFMAGTAVPDWLSVVDRKMRVRARGAQPFTQNDDRRIASLAAGIVRHHHDDRWFHQTRAFAELNLQFTVAVRDVLADDAGFRPSFLGHILVELFLDATLFENSIERLDAYYEAVDSLNVDLIGRAVNQMATRESEWLPVFVSRFCKERFLYDYLDDEKLLARLNHVMHRVRLPELPNAILQVFPEARNAVRGRRDELLSEYLYEETKS